MAKRLIFSIHAVQRMFERGISTEEIRAIIERGEAIEAYTDDQPYPSRLVLGKVGPKYLHVVVASNVEASEEIVVTVYLPDLERWNSDMRTRRKK